MMTKKAFPRIPALILALVLAELTLTTQAASPSPHDPPPRPFPRQIEPLLPFGAIAAPTAPSGEHEVASVPTWSRLAFQSYRNENWEIYIADSQGNNQDRRTNNGAADIHPRLNRGCTRIVFTSTRDGGDYDIHAMNYDGSGLVQLTPNGSDDVFPAWSPDGSRIAFESYRDGQAEVYVMNADGSGQTRLTTNSSYDGMPAWSPDGSRIAFVSYRTGGYRIWVMNADGSEPIQLSNQPYSEGPVWSPDGSWIAYDADGDSDGWQELWAMPADGSVHYQVLDAGANTDAWAGSWSANGQYIAFTRISFIYYQGYWYWTSAYLDAWDSQSGGTIRLSNVGLDWQPDWQATDAQVPSSSVSPLPSESPSPFVVNWSGSDTGGSGLMNYDVQVRDGPAGPWTDWQMNTASTAASYPGVGGHTYYFRSRARDWAYNVEAWPAFQDALTMVEDHPPMTAVDSLPVYLPTPVTVTVRWGGWDPGGSGIQHFDVQIRDGAGGTWTNWQVQTANRSGSFTGTAGHTYFFRSRGIDNAQNEELWPSGGGDAHVTFYTWAIAGTVRDNTGTPVVGAVITTTPEAFEAQTSSPGGHYAAYVAGGAGSYIADWARSDYGSLPSTSFSMAPDVQFDVTLPPADNAILNWGFESGSLGPGDWGLGGDIAPVVTDTVRHTGEYAALLGQIPALSTAVSLWSGDPYGWPVVQTAMATDGSLHVMWLADVLASTIYYTRRDANETWSPVEAVATSGLYPGWAGMAVADDGTVHIVWAGYEDEGDIYSEIFHAWRSGNGPWSSPQNISNTPDNVSSVPHVVVDSTGALHVVWTEMVHDGSGWTYPLLYRRWDPDGTWSDAQNLSADTGVAGSTIHSIAMGSDDSVHVAWIAVNSLWHVRRDDDGTWGSPLPCAGVSYSSHSPQIAVDGSGRAHMVWDDGDAGIGYVTRGLGGGCTEQAAILPGDAEGPMPQVVVTPDEGVHVSWGAYHTWRRAGGNWSDPIRVLSLPGEPASALAVGESGSVHGAWVSDRLYYARWSDANGWIPLASPAGSYDGAAALSMVADSEGVAHVVWPNTAGATVWYAGTTPAAQSGDSSVLQTVTVPITLSAPVLSFLYSLHDASAGAGTGFSVQVDDGVTSTTLLSTTTDSAWTQRWFDLTAWAGQTITLSFRVNEVASRPPCWAYLDEVSLGSSYPDLWVSKGTVAALPGEQVAYTVEYGNRGGAAASGVLITDTLPGALFFVDASPQPLTTAPSLVWDVGDLAGRSGPFAIVITATMAPTATLWTEYTNTVRIESASPELELHNNIFLATVFVGRRVYLPAMMRGY